MMESLEALVTEVQGLSSSADDLSHLHKILKTAEEKHLLLSNSSRLGSVLNQLDPSYHSLGYLYVLDAYTSASTTQDQARGIVSTVAGFIDSCVSEQIRLEPHKFISVCKRFKDKILLLQTPIQGVAPMLTAIRKLQSSSGKLTTLHSDFLLLCLLAKCYKTGYSILEEDIFETDQPRDLFLYCYYGGMICIGQKCYRKAIELLYNVVTAPTSAVNAICIEAYKKYILISLIHTGQFLSNIPKHASIVTSRTVKTSCQHYYDLGEIYSTGKISELEGYVQNNREKFESENNLGLVRQVVSSLCKRIIQRLTQTYLTLSLQDIANRVQLNSPKEAEMHVLQMIQNGEIFATINQKDGMVSFHEDPEQYKSCEMIQHIDSSIQRIMGLSKKLNDVDEIISCDPNYLTKHYYDLGEIYSTGKISELEGYVQNNREKFESENNLGLVRQVVSSLCKRIIQRLTQTYLTLSLQDIANRVQLNSPKEAEMHVLQMIQNGEIFATINQKDGMVSFHEDPEQYKSCEMIQHIDSSIQRIMGLSKKLNDVDEIISCDPNYLTKVGKDRHQRLDFDDFDQPHKFYM